MSKKCSLAASHQAVATALKHTPIPCKTRSLTSTPPMLCVRSGNLETNCSLPDSCRMAALASTPSRRTKPLRPLTPLGQDLPEDTPSKIRARHARDCAALRRQLVRDIIFRMFDVFAKNPEAAGHTTGSQ